MRHSKTLAPFIKDTELLPSNQALRNHFLGMYIDHTSERDSRSASPLPTLTQPQSKPPTQPTRTDPNPREITSSTAQQHGLFSAESEDEGFASFESEDSEDEGTGLR